MYVALCHKLHTLLTLLPPLTRFKGVVHKLHNNFRGYSKTPPPSLCNNCNHFDVPGEGWGCVCMLTFALMVWGTLIKSPAFGKNVLQSACSALWGGAKSYMGNAKIHGATFTKVLPLVCRRPILVPNINHGFSSLTLVHPHLQERATFYSQELTIFLFNFSTKKTDLAKSVKIKSCVRYQFTYF